MTAQVFSCITNRFLANSKILNRPMHRFPIATFLFLLTSFTAVTSCGHQPPPVDSSTKATAPVAEPVVQEILAEMVDPPGAVGRRLTLVRYTIAPKVRLASHLHPGVQMAWIVSGTLTYHVVSGAVTVSRGGKGTRDPRAIEALVGPAETTLGPGDAVMEPKDMLHFGVNHTDDPVVIMATLLTESGKELAVLPDPDSDE